MRAILLFIASTFFSMLCAVEVSLWVDHIEIYEETDTFGDQIYAFILEKDPNGDFSQFTHPTFPFSFTKDGLSTMKPFSLWQSVFVDGDHYEIIFSLFDREVMPWLPDELLGHLKIGMSWEDKKLDVAWKGLSPDTTVEENDNMLVRRVIMKENGGHYAIDLRLHLNKA